ncbi:MAG: hypothetical protein OK456_11190 [Thaumarchaeota archaeon]|nr:hypothetical protein [Nitrososphaerota archaeon]
MSDSNKNTHVYLDEATYKENIPKPEELFPIPSDLLGCLLEIAPKILKSGAWWSVCGDLSETIMGVHVRPSGIEIMTDGAGLSKVLDALSGYKATPIAVERRLNREAEVDLNKYPVFERFTGAEFTWNGAQVTIQGDYQLKVGDWEWGDPYFFKPEIINISTVRMPVMPLGLRTEIYITFGWLDRADLIAQAYAAAHKEQV